MRRRSGPGPIYTSLKATSQHQFPVLASLRALEREPGAKPGLCQARECTAQADYLRAWLSPQELMKLKLATLNGVRYCQAHAYDLALDQGMPIFHRRTQILMYHSQVLSASVALEEQPEIALKTPDATIVGKHGAARRQHDGSILVTQDDGSEELVCCYPQAIRKISTAPGKRPPRQHPDVHASDCIGVG